MDEPTTGLDPQTRRRIWEVIERLRSDENLTVFLTTHYMESEKLPEEMITAIRETLDCNPQFHGNVVNTTQMVFIMAGSIVVLGAIFLLMTRLPEKENR